MAHPYQESRQHKVERSRVSHITKGYASEGGHSDEAADRKLVKSMVKDTSLKADGDKPKVRLDRFARGGAVKGKGKTTVNVIVAPGGGQDKQPMPMPVPVPAGAAPAPMPPPRPPMMPPGAPGAGPPGMPMRASGGRIKTGPTWEEGLRNGTQVQHDKGKNDQNKISDKPALLTRRNGGRAYPLTAGAESGLGRLQKTRAQKKTYP